MMGMIRLQIDKHLFCEHCYVALNCSIWFVFWAWNNEIYGPFVVYLGFFFLNVGF